MNNQFRSMACPPSTPWICDEAMPAQCLRAILARNNPAGGDVYGRSFTRFCSPRAGAAVSSFKCEPTCEPVCDSVMFTQAAVRSSDVCHVVHVGHTVLPIAYVRAPARPPVRMRLRTRVAHCFIANIANITNIRKEIKYLPLRRQQHGDSHCSHGSARASKRNGLQLRKCTTPRTVASHLAPPPSRVLPAAAYTRVVRTPIRPQFHQVCSWFLPIHQHSANCGSAQS